MNKIMTPKEWLDKSFFPQDRPSHPCLESTMEQYAKYVVSKTKKQTKVKKIK